MGLMDMLGLGRAGQLRADASTAADAVADAVAVAVAAPDIAVTAPFTRAELVARDLVLTIPAVRKARQAIAGVISTFTLTAWSGTQRLDPTDSRTAWIRQPSPDRPLSWLLRRTIDDGLWYDRAVWRADRNIAGQATRFERIHPQRITTIHDPRDPDTVRDWIIDGTHTSDRDLVVFDFGGMGGLRRMGADLLDLYAQLQRAAGRYAASPHPKAILKNTGGVDLTEAEVDELLDSWEAARAVSSTGYLGGGLEYEVTSGWSARELQLTEAREHAALEVARLFGLPAFAVDAQSGDSMTYGNVVERRRDHLEALRPWTTTVEQTLSMDNRAARPEGRWLPYGISVAFDPGQFVQLGPAERMAAWSAGITSGVLTVDEARAAEPLTRTA